MKPSTTAETLFAHRRGGVPVNMVSTDDPGRVASRAGATAALSEQALELELSV